MRSKHLGPLVALALVVAGCSGDEPGPSTGATTSVETTPSVGPSGSPAPEPVYRFVDVSSEVGVEMDARRSWGGTWIDHDDDGDPDLLANRHFFPPFYFDHDGDRYVKSPLQEALNSEDFDRHACMWGDPNADGLLDVLCTQGAERGKGIGPNQLLVQGADGSFSERAEEFGVAYPPGRSRSANWVDYDNDTDLDLFIGAEYRAGYPNQMFRNDDGRFRIVDVGLDDELKTEATAWADWDRDGDLDLIATVKKGRTVAYENRAGRFLRVQLPYVTDRDWLGASFGAYNRDRWPDLHLVSESRSLVLRNRMGDLRPVHRMATSQGRTGLWFDADDDSDQDLFILQGAPGEGDDPDAVDAPDVLLIREGYGFRRSLVRSSGVPTGNGDSSAVSDHDRDGDLDLFVTNGYKRTAGPFLVLENRSTIQNWAALDLSGDPGDPLGMWAEIKVTTEQGTYWRRITDGLVFRSQSEIGHTHLGLAAARSAAVEVRWWGGGRDCVEIEAGSVGRLAEGSSPC